MVEPKTHEGYSNPNIFAHSLRSLTYVLACYCTFFSLAGSLDSCFGLRPSYSLRSQGTGVSGWEVGSVTPPNFGDSLFSYTFGFAVALTACNKRLIADAWASKSTVFTGTTTYVADWAGVYCPIDSDATFKEASWDFINAKWGESKTKWGAIEDWDLSLVKDMSYAFAKDRSEAGGTVTQLNGNPKAALANFADLSKWITSAVTSMQSTFSGAAQFSYSGLDAWDVAKVSNMWSTFSKASSFNIDVRRALTTPPQTDPLLPFSTSLLPFSSAFSSAYSAFLPRTEHLAIR